MAQISTWGSNDAVVIFLVQFIPEQENAIPPLNIIFKISLYL